MNSKDVFRHQSRHERTVHSAQVIVSILKEILAPESVVDIGCGVGTFLHAFKEDGCRQILGIDSTKYLDQEYLKISGDEFIDADLEAPVVLEKRYDLALSLEVAEHLQPASAAQFVKSLVNSSDVVCFSAAIPGQGGKGHVNEQWPDYWIDLFEKKDYEMIDCIRPLIWYDRDVPDWYKMNILVFVRRNTAVSKRIKSQDLLTGIIPSIVHPERFERVVNELRVLREKRNRWGLAAFKTLWMAVRRDIFGQHTDK